MQGDINVNAEAQRVLAAGPDRWAQLGLARGADLAEGEKDRFDEGPSRLLPAVIACCIDRHPPAARAAWSSASLWHTA